MARKNILSGLMGERPAPGADAGSAPPEASPSPAAGTQQQAPSRAPETKSAGSVKSIGALGAVTRSIDALAARADAAKALEERLSAGSVIVELEPSQIENSFISDRLNHDDEAFRDLVEAIRSRGQDSPILVRPHPMKPGVYQIAFGHRRARAARELGIPVRAVVKNLSDIDHVIAQGQENSARADLSFIERAVFATKLETLGFGRDVIMAALGSDKTTVSKMLSVTGRIPGYILNMLMESRTTGRDRWHELATLFDQPGAADRALQFLESRARVPSTAEERIAMLMDLLKTPADTAKPGEKRKRLPERQVWTRADRPVRADLSRSGSRYTIALKSPPGQNLGPDFGAYLATRLDALYEDFEKSRKT